MNIFELDVKTVPVGHNRVLWECALSWDDLALLIANPACFVQSTVGRRLGDLKRYPIVVVNISYPPAECEARGDDDDSSDVIVQGIDDTSVITVRVKNLPDDPGDLPDLKLDETMRVQVVLRLEDRLATAHFHLAGDSHAVKRETYKLVRTPLAYAPALNRLVDKGLVDVVVIDSDRGSDSYRSAAKKEAKRETVRFSTEPTVRSLTLQFDSSMDEIAGCHSVDGTVTSQPGSLTVGGTTVNCVAYAPEPAPPVPPSSNGATSGAGMSPQNPNASHPPM